MSVLIDVGWAVWIADNRLKDCPPEVLVQRMVAAGIDASAARRAVVAAEHEAGFIAARKLQQLQRKQASVLATLFQLQQMRTGAPRIERRAAVSTEEFFERYYCGNQPLILTDLARAWPAMQRWTPAYFRERFGDVMVEIQAGRDADPDYEMNSPRHKRTVRLADFIDGMTRAASSNDQYLTANNHALERPELAPLLNDIGPLPNWFGATRLARQALLWMGPRGVITPLHHDTIQLMHTHIVGRKRWRFISPLQTALVHNHIGVFSKLRLERPDANFPIPTGLQIIDETILPGETLFLPVGWWHHVECLDACMSLSYTHFAFPNQFHYDNPDIRDW
ncbi:MAG: cupin-like domain-containing protein [Microbacteriaceae bacterium]|nr:cupin-like domain-containing protein [Burkholderiaceae bacterium]